MPYAFEFDSARRILGCRLEGQVTDEELREYYRAAALAAEQTDPLGGILDLSKVTSFDIPPSTIRELAKSRPAIPNESIPRILIAPAPNVFGIARMFELQGQETRPNLHVVRSLKEALAILGIQEIDFEPLEPR